MAQESARAGECQQKKKAHGQQVQSNSVKVRKKNEWKTGQNPVNSVYIMENLVIFQSNRKSAGHSSIKLGKT